MSDQTIDPTGNGSDPALDRTKLPIRRAAFSGVANETLGGSEPGWEQIGHVKPPEGAPNVLVVLVTGTSYSRPNGGRGVPPEKDLDRFDSTVALVVMPGCQPVGVYTVRGDEWPADQRRIKGDGPDLNQALARWVTDFLKKPASVPAGGWPAAGKRRS